MPGATRLGDLNTGHDDCPAVALVEASTSVLINGRGAGRVGDAYAIHECVTVPHLPHVGHISSGSSTVLINGRPAGRIGDSVDCPVSCTVAQGSGNVQIGG